MKKLYVLSIILFILPIVALSLYSAVDPDNAFSYSENRPLSSFPEVSLESIVDGSFRSGFEGYYNDQFPGREIFLSIAKKFASAFYPSMFISEDDVISLPPTNVSQNTDPDSAPESLNGTMIYKGRIMEIFNVSDSKAKGYAEIINELYLDCGSPDTYVILPTPAFTLYAPEDKIDEKTDFDIAVSVVEKTLDGPVFVDTREVFKEKKGEGLYFNTDHHWTARGAYYALRELLEVSGDGTLSPLSEYRSGKRNGFLGSLYRSVKDNPVSSVLEKHADTVEYFYPFSNAEVFSYPSLEANGEKRALLYPEYDRDTNLYCIYMGGDIALGHMKSGVGNGKSILVVRDSYGHAFIPFLADIYEDVYFVEPRYFNSTDNRLELGAFFKEKEIDTLLFLNYPNMAVGGYWDSISNYLKNLT